MKKGLEGVPTRGVLYSSVWRVVTGDEKDEVPSCVLGHGVAQI